MRERKFNRLSLRTILMWGLFFIAVSGVYWLSTQVSKCTRERELTLEPTPLHIESIEAIAQLATLSYREEFVIDSIEYYQSANEQLKGELEKIFKQGDFKNTLKNYNIDRRLTLISTVSAEIGFDLEKIIQESTSPDTVIIHSPQPKILNIGIDFRETEVFIEIGRWKDSDRRILENKALAKARKILNNDQLLQKSKDKFEALIRKTVPSKICIFEYDENH